MERSVDVVNVVIVDDAVVIDICQVARVGDVMIDAPVHVIEIGAVERTAVIGVDRIFRAVDLLVRTRSEAEREGEEDVLHT